MTPYPLSGLGTMMGSAQARRRCDGRGKCAMPDRSPSHPATGACGGSRESRQRCKVTCVTRPGAPCRPRGHRRRCSRPGTGSPRLRAANRDATGCVTPVGLRSWERAVLPMRDRSLSWQAPPTSAGCPRCDPGAGNYLCMPLPLES
ncbi:membrane protein (plasmid) [Ralstonia solanacearum]|nr:membrane protein [Ralstonia solanacearum]